MKKIKNNKILFTYLSEKDEYEMKTDNQIYESQDKCFLDIEDELNNVPISELPTDVNFQTTLGEATTYVDFLTFNKNKKNLVEANVMLSVYPKFCYENIGYEKHFEPYEKMILKYSSYKVSDITKEFDTDRPGIFFVLELNVNRVIDLYNVVRELDTKINDAIWKVVEEMFCCLDERLFSSSSKIN